MAPGEQPIDPSALLVDPLPDASPSLGPIARHVQAVLGAFHTAVAGTTAAKNNAVAVDTAQFLTQLKNEETRFKIWAGNLGAHQAGRSSLDYRLREAPHLQEQVVYLLRDATESLESAFAIIQPQMSDMVGSGTQKSDGPDDAIEDSDASSFTDSDPDEPSPEVQLSTICTDIREATDCLLRLSVAIANPAPHERFRKFGAVDISYQEPHDVAHVRNKFPKLSPDMADVLGKSITRRRQFFRYRLAHHEKLAAGLEPPGAEQARDDGRTEAFPETVASTLPEHIKTRTNLDLRNGVINEDNHSDTAASMTSYATSAGFSAEECDGEVFPPPPPVRVPPPPKEAKYGNFECPFCYRMISASTRAAWKRHVFGDLRPYTCLFKDCLDSNADFDGRRRWRAHIAQHHWKSWACVFGCDGAYASASDLRVHINTCHIRDASVEQLEAVVVVGERPMLEDTATSCPICSQSTAGLRQYTRHVGRHLEQLTLFALPRLDQDDSDSDEGSDSDGAALSKSGSGSAGVAQANQYDQVPTADEDQPTAGAAGDSSAVAAEIGDKNNGGGSKGADSSPDPGRAVDTPGGPAEELENRQQSLWRRFLGRERADITVDAQGLIDTLDEGEDSKGIIRRVSRKVVPGLPRSSTFKRQQSDLRDKLEPVEPTPAEGRAVSVDRRVPGNERTSALDYFRDPSLYPDSEEEEEEGEPAAAFPDNNSSRKELLSKALEKANRAVQLDGEKDLEAARVDYTEACDLIKVVIQRTSDPEERQKLTNIVATYEGRLAGLAEDGVSGLARPSGSRAANEIS